MHPLLVKTVACWLLHQTKLADFNYTIKSSFLLKAALFFVFDFRNRIPSYDGDPPLPSQNLGHRYV